MSFEVYTEISARNLQQQFMSYKARALLLFPFLPALAGELLLQDYWACWGSVRRVETLGEV